MSAAILFSQMTPPPGEEVRFEQWYDDEHIARRMRLEGFSGALRYWQVREPETPEPHHLAIYELDSLNALETPEYRALKGDPDAETEHFLSSVTGFTRFTAENIHDEGDVERHGDYLFVVAFAVPEEARERFDDWYDTEHAPLLLEAPDWLRVHRYRVLNGDGGAWTHLALHELSSLDVMRSPERARARNGPKRDALAGESWFAESGRWLYEPVASHP